MTSWKTDKYLIQMFEKYNKKYFGNRLSGKIRIGWRAPFKKGHAAEHIVLKDGMVLILINPKLKEWGAQNYALSSLLHEMVHQLLYQQNHGPSVFHGHGNLFQKEMKRLASRGTFKSLW